MEEHYQVHFMLITDEYAMLTQDECVLRGHSLGSVLNFRRFGLIDYDILRFLSLRLQLNFIVYSIDDSKFIEVCESKDNHYSFVVVENFVSFKILM